MALAGLPCSGGWQGDREWNRGLPGAEPRLWDLAWDRAGEPGAVCWSTEGKEGESCLVIRGGAAAGIPKLLPLTIIWLDRLNITLKGSLWEHRALKRAMISKQVLTSVKTSTDQRRERWRGRLCTSYCLKSPSWPGPASSGDCVLVQLEVPQDLKQLHHRTYPDWKLEPAEATWTQAGSLSPVTHQFNKDNELRPVYSGCTCREVH